MVSDSKTHLTALSTGGKQTKNEVIYITDTSSRLTYFLV